MAIFDNGLAPITQVAETETANVPRSKFNMSCVKYTNGIIGALEPIDLLETLPNEDYEIGYDVLAQLRNPTVRQALNGMKIFVHSYWCPKKDLWKGFKNYITGGRSGEVNLQVPLLCPIIASDENGGAIDQNAITPSDTDVNTFVPFAPSSFMGIPPVLCAAGRNGTAAGGGAVQDTTYDNKNYWFGAVTKTNDATGASHGFKRLAPMQGVKGSNEAAWDTNLWWKVSALPFVMYNKIYRDYYANENMLAKNKHWYHDDEDEDLILPYSLPAANKTGYVNCTDGTCRNLLKSDRIRAHVPMYNATETNGDYPMLNMLHFRQFRGDYFTTANIFKDLMRGDSSVLDSELSFDINVDDMFEVPAGSTSNAEFAVAPIITKGGAYDGKLYGIMNESSFAGSLAQYKADSTLGAPYTAALKKWYEQLKVSGSGILNKLRKAVVLEKLMTRNATTNGSYRELIGVQFGYYPNDYNRRPTYIGGAEYAINFNTITATNYDSQTTNLGQKTSDAYASGSGYIGKFHSDDHGYIMTILSIVPDVYYKTQGLAPIFTRTTKDKEYTPLLNNLEPMAIKNKELFMSSDPTYNEDVWGYADRFEDWKSRRNQISGLAVCGEVFDRSQFMMREFNDGNKPNLNELFNSMYPSNIDMSIFTSKNEPPFDITIGCNITKVSPMPYKAQPADMGIKY